VSHFEEPHFAILGAIGYRVTVADSQVIFDQEGGIYGTHTQFAFERPKDINDSPGIWYFVWIDSSSNRVPARHLTDAVAFLERNFGHSFQPYKGALQL
jgi:hypothetical protein